MTTIKRCHEREQRRHWNSKAMDTTQERVSPVTTTTRNTADLPPRSGSLKFLARCPYLCPEWHHNSWDSDKKTQHRSPHANRSAAWGKGLSEGSILTTAGALKEVSLAMAPYCPQGKNPNSPQRRVQKALHQRHPENWTALHCDLEPINEKLPQTRSGTEPNCLLY